MFMATALLSKKIKLLAIVTLSILGVCYIVYQIFAMPRGIYDSIDTSQLGDVTKNPDTHEQERSQLMDMLSSQSTVEECNTLSQKIVSLGSTCSWSFNQWLCLDQGQFYGQFMAKCMSSIGAKKGDQGLCSNQLTNKGICDKWMELSSFPVWSRVMEFASGVCAADQEKSCLLLYGSKVEDGSRLTLDCPSYEEGMDRDECFGLLAAARHDVNACNAIPDDFMRDRCFSYFALQLHDEKICSRMVTDYLQRDCLKNYEIVVNAASENVCNDGKVTDSRAISSTEQGECLLAYAIYHQDRTLCEKYRGEGPFINGVCDRYTRVVSK